MNGERDWLGLFDETLEDGPLPVPRDADLRRQLADQRFVHGLLRAAHGADASSREARVQAVVAGLPADQPRRRRGLWITAVASVGLGLAAALTIRALLPVPRAEIALQQALDQVAADAHHRFALTVTVTAPDRELEGTVRYALTTHLGGRFLLEGEGWLAPLRAGSDGDTVWCAPAVAWLRWSRPFARDCQLGWLFGQSRLTAGDFDLREWLLTLRRAAPDLAVRAVAGVDGRSRARVEWIDRHSPADGAAIEVDEARGTLERLEVSSAAPGGFRRHLTFDYRGPAEGDVERYRRPW